jgi:hypothetical protein
MSLRTVHPELVLHLSNGKRIKNLYELASELATMDEEVFRYHVQEQRNDFANWLLHIVGDEHLARVFAQIRDRRLLLAAVEKRIDQLEHPAPKLTSHTQFHFTAREYLLGVLIGAIAMLLVTRLL